MPAPTRTVTTDGQYKGHNYTIEQVIAQMFSGGHLVTERPSFVRLYVDSRSIVPARDIPGRKFTEADESLEAVQTYIDQLEAQKKLDRLEDQKHPGTKMVLTIGRTSTHPQKHYEPL